MMLLMLQFMLLFMMLFMMLMILVLLQLLLLLKLVSESHHLLVSLAAHTVELFDPARRPLRRGVGRPRDPHGLVLLLHDECGLIESLRYLVNSVFFNS